MGEDYRTERVLSSWMVQEFAPSRDGTHHHRLPHHSLALGYDPPHPAPPAPVEDWVRVLGLTPEKMDPALLSALTPLFSELEQLRAQAHDDHHRLARLEREAGRDPSLACLNRPSFIRHLDALIRDGNAHGALACLHLDGLSPIARLLGLAAAEAALAHAVHALQGGLENGDLLAHLGLGHFALFLAGADLSTARSRLPHLSQRLTQPPFIWKGQRLALGGETAILEIRSPLTAQDLLSALDDERRGIAIL